MSVMMEIYMSQWQKAASRGNKFPNYEEAVLQEVKVVKAHVVIKQKTF